MVRLVQSQARAWAARMLRGTRDGVSLQVRTALEAHAQKQGTSFVNIVVSLAANVRHAAASAQGAAPAAVAGRAAFASQEFTPSRHASLLRAAGAERARSAAAEVDGATCGVPSPPDSPASAVIPVAAGPVAVIVEEAEASPGCYGREPVATAEATAEA